MEFSINITVEDGHQRVDISIHEALAELLRASEDGELDGTKSMEVDDQMEVEGIADHFGVQNVTIHRLA